MTIDTVPSKTKRRIISFFDNTGGKVEKRHYPDVGKNFDLR